MASRLATAAGRPALKLAGAARSKSLTPARNAATRRSISMILQTAPEAISWQVIPAAGNMINVFCHEVSSGLAEYEVYNPPLTVFSKQEDALADVSGEKNTMDLVAYTKQKNASAAVGEYFMHKTLVDEERGVFYEWPDSVFFHHL